MHAYVFSVCVYAYTSIYMQKYIHLYVSMLIKEEVTNLGVIRVSKGQGQQERCRFSAHV